MLRIHADGSRSDLFIEIERHVRPHDLNFGVCLDKLSQTRHMGTDEPFRQPIGDIIDCQVERESITAVEDPAISRSDSNARMPGGVPDQGNQPQFRFKTSQVNGIEANPFFAAQLVRHPVWCVGPVVLDKEYIRSSPKGIFIFGLVKMNLRPGKIRQAAGMVKVQMGHEDMANIIRPVTQAPDLMEGGLSKVTR